MVQNNMYLTNGNDEVYKYDGRNFYRAGIIPWQPGLFLSVENVASGGIPLAGDSFTVTGTSLSGKNIRVTKAAAALVSQNDVVQVTFIKAGTTSVVLFLTVAEIIQEISGTDSTISFKEPLSVSFVPDSIQVVLVYAARYAFRLNIRDVNGVTTASAVTGTEDFVVQLTPEIARQQKVLLRLVGMPAWDQYDYSNKNIELEVYRTLWTTQSVGEVPVFYRVATRALTFYENNGYIDIVDTYSNDSVSQQDVVVGALVGGNVGQATAWDEPARAKYVTTAGNQLVLGNVTDWPTLTTTFVTNNNPTADSFVGQKFLYRRDSADISTTTNMVDRVTYELVPTSGAKNVNIYPIATAAAGLFKFKTTNTLPTGLAAGDWVYLYHSTPSAGNTYTVSGVNLSTETITATGSAFTVGTLIHFSSTGTLPAPLVAGRGYFVISPSGTSFSVSESYGGGTINLTTAGTGTISVLSDGSQLDYAGWWMVNDVTSSEVTILDVNSSTTTVPIQFPDRAVFATNLEDVPVLVGLDGNMAMANGNGPVPYLNILRRLGMAINTTMRLVDTNLAAYVEFKPWIVARSGSDTGGQLVVKQPRAESVIPSVKITGGTSEYSTYVNGSKINSLAIVASITRYPSRILASYNNYPEIFDNPWTVDTDGSASAIDINSADGQEITGIIPFFGESAFGAALQSGVLVVFKQNSIYLVDLGAKAAGQNAVQRLETQGLGCTAPYSIAPTKDGIAFANDSGIYVLRRNQRIEYLGRFMERNWQEKVDKNFLDIVQGHHYSVGRQYKLSVPMVEDSTSSYAENSQVYVYNHTGEADGETGGWARYTNHPATGWANLFKDAFYANVNGSVLRLRNLGEQTDYRDGSSAIESILEARATSFGNTGIRKVVSNCIVHYRTAENSSGTKVYFAPDLYSEYDESTNFSIKTKSAIQDNLSSSQAQAIVSVMHSLVRRRCIYMSVKIINAAKDENVEVAGMSFMVGGLSPGGIKQAADTE
jgi:hypothetical protein